MRKRNGRTSATGLLLCLQFWESSHYWPFDFSLQFSLLLFAWSCCKTDVSSICVFGVSLDLQATPWRNSSQWAHISYVCSYLLFLQYTGDTAGAWENQYVYWVPPICQAVCQALYLFVLISPLKIATHVLLCPFYRGGKKLGMSSKFPLKSSKLFKL